VEIDVASGHARRFSLKLCFCHYLVARLMVVSFWHTLTLSATSRGTLGPPALLCPFPGLFPFLA
jgi:hypothetical protein